MLHLKDFCAQICQRVNRVRLQNFLNALKQEILRYKLYQT